MTHRLNKGGNFTLNKHERLDEIAKLVNKKGTIRTNEIVEGLNVSDMTVRIVLHFLQVLVYLSQVVFQISVQWVAYLMKFQKMGFRQNTC